MKRKKIKKSNVVSMEEFIKQHRFEMHIKLFDLLRSCIGTLETCDDMLEDFVNFDDQSQSKLIEINLNLSSSFRIMAENLYTRAKRLQDIRNEFEKEAYKLVEKYEKGQLTLIEGKGE